MQKRKLVYLGLAICLIASMLLAFGCAKPAPAEKITLKAVSCFPVDHIMVSQTGVFIDRVNQAGGGEVVIDWIGGPEAVPRRDQFDAVKTGTVDFVFGTSAFYAYELPECDTFHLSEYTPWEERETGYYDFMVERHKKSNVRYLGRFMSEAPFYLYLTKKVEKLDDLKGLTMRSGAIYVEFMETLGIKPVDVAFPDTYTALQRGTIDGTGWPPFGVVDAGWSEVLKCCIDHPFYNQNGTIIMNLDSWNKIGKKVQDKILGLTPQFERDMAAFYANAAAGEFQKMRDAGIEFVKFSPAEAEQYVKLAYEASWGVTRGKVSPEDYAKLQELLKK